MIEILTESAKFDSNQRFADQAKKKKKKEKKKRRLT